VCSESNLRNGPHNNNAPAHSLLSVQKFLAITVMTITLHPLYSWIPVPCAIIQKSKLAMKGKRFHDLSIIQEQSQATPAAFQTKDIHRCSHNGIFSELTVSNCKGTNLNGNSMELHVNAGITDSRITPGNFLIMLHTLGTCDIVLERSVILKHKY